MTYTINYTLSHWLLTAIAFGHFDMKCQPSCKQMNNAVPRKQDNIEQSNIHVSINFLFVPDDAPVI